MNGSQPGSSVYGILQARILAAASAAAKSLQSCPTLCDPVDGSPPGSNVPGILQARTLEWAAIAFSEMTLYARQQKRHRYKEQTFGLCRRRRGWDVLREQHQNMYNMKGETDHQIGRAHV